MAQKRETLLIAAKVLFSTTDVLKGNRVKILMDIANRLLVIRDVALVDEWLLGLIQRGIVKISKENLGLGVEGHGLVFCCCTETGEVNERDVLAQNTWS
jgi:hypothetical protein